MEAMRESWTDERLDDLNGKVDAVRLEMKTDFAAVRSEMGERFDKVDARFERMEKRFDKVDERFERVDERFERSEARSEHRFEAMMDRLYAMQRLMIQFCGAALAALLGVIGALVVLAVQL
jgi:predicted nuclease with TOPRIM domain